MGETPGSSYHGCGEWATDPHPRHQLSQVGGEAEGYRPGAVKLASTVVKVELERKKKIN